MFRFRDDPVIARAAPFLLFIGFLVLGSAFAAPGWLVIARSVVVGLVLLWFWRGYAELRQPGRTHPAYWLAAVAGGCGVFLVWIGFNQDWAVLSRPSGFAPQLPGGGVDWSQAIARLAGFALIVPVMEELFWRSLVLRWIEKHDFLAVAPRQVGWRGFVITTVLFALEHDRWFAGAVAGAVYNWLYMRSGNLWVPIVAHIVTNGVLGVWVLYTGRWEFW